MSKCNKFKKKKKMSVNNLAPEWISKPIGKHVNTVWVSGFFPQFQTSFSCFIQIPNSPLFPHY